jgi:hypothetical protein
MSFTNFWFLGMPEGWYRDLEGVGMEIQDVWVSEGNTASIPAPNVFAA